MYENQNQIFSPPILSNNCKPPLYLLTLQTLCSVSIEKLFASYSANNEKKKKDILNSETQNVYLCFDHHFTNYNNQGPIIRRTPTYYYYAYMKLTYRVV